MNYVTNFSLLGNKIVVRDPEAVRSYDQFSDIADVHDGNVIFLKKYSDDFPCECVYVVSTSPTMPVYTKQGSLYLNLYPLGNVISPAMHGEKTGVNLDKWLKYISDNITLDISECTCTITPTNKAIDGVNNVTIIATGATIISNNYNGADLRQLYFTNSSNITVNGGKWNHDCSKNAYTQNREQAHNMRFIDSTAVTVCNAEIYGASGDGIEFGNSNSNSNFDTTFTAFNNYIHHVHRNGISVLNGRHIIIHDCTFSNITQDEHNNTMPLAMVDVEPFLNDAKVGIVDISNINTLDFSSGGIVLYAGKDTSIFNISNVKTSNLTTRVWSNYNNHNIFNLKNVTLSHILDIGAYNSTYNLDVIFDQYTQTYVSAQLCTREGGGYNISGNITFNKATNTVDTYRLQVNSYATDSVFNLKTNTFDINNIANVRGIHTTAVNENSNSSIGNGQKGYVHDIVYRASATQARIEAPAQYAQPLTVIFLQASSVVDNSNGKVVSPLSFPLTIKAGDVLHIYPFGNDKYVVTKD